MMKQKVIVITGPTGIGKTDLSLYLCEKYNGEIINADASAMKRKLNIGTAKPDLTKTNVVHHLIDIINPDERYSCSDFQKNARVLIEKINNESKIPFIVGGTGLYISTCLYDYTLENKTRDKTYEDECSDYSNSQLHQILKNLDEESFNKIHQNNRIRIIRAIECAKNGKKISEEKGKNKPYYDALIICLQTDRTTLYNRIDKRVDMMIEDGFIDEVKSLIDSYDVKSFPDLGYKQIASYLDNEITLDEAISETKFASHHYAKRQITWFKHQMNPIFVDIDYNNLDNTKEVISNLIDNYLKDL